MVAYNLPTAAAQPVIFGARMSLIKGHGKRAHVVPGGTVHLFCGNLPPDYNRSPDCHRLMDAPCTVSDPLSIDSRGAVRHGARVVHGDWLHELARAEGFANFGDLQGHYDRLHGLPWEGQFIRWDPFRATFRAQWPLIVKPPPDDVEDTE